MANCARLCPARIIAPSFNRWLTARIFPRRDPCNSSWTLCVPSCPQTPKTVKEFRKFYSYRIQNIHAGSEFIFSHYASVQVISLVLCRIQIIHTGSKVVVYRWLFQGFYSCQILCTCWIILLNTTVVYLKLFVPGPRIWNCSRVSDWYKRIKSYGFEYLRKGER